MLSFDIDFCFYSQSIFRNLKVLSAIEMGLGGNVNYHDIRRLKWETNSNRSLPKGQSKCNLRLV